MNKFWLLSLFFSTLGGMLCGQTVYRAAKIQASPTQVFQPGEILVKDGKILAIGKTAKAPKGSKTIDWKDLEVYPGLISPGSSLGLAEINALRPTRDEREVGTHTPDVEAWVAVNPDSELIPVARANGVTHSIIAPMGGMISGTSGLIVLDGWGVEEMTIRKKVALHLWWPGHSLGLPQPHSDKDAKPKSIKEQDKERRQRVRDIDEFFDQAEAYRQGRKADPEGLGVIPSWEAMMPVLEGKIPLMIHADEVRQIKAAVEWAEKRKYRMILSGGQDAWKLADWLGERKIPVIYHHIFTAPRYRNSPHDEQFRAPGILAKAGVPLSIGFRLGGWTAANQRNLPYHAAQAVAHGLSRGKALASITMEPAKLAGVSKRLGSLEVGKEATFIATTGDLLDLRSSVKHMIISGRSTSLQSRHTRLYERYRNRPKPREKP
ncbi:MAG: amidohydrolase family protein [Opitutae bacterium]|jgi:imidazolonepropionase-like amidohydrolase|nr:amidohydrolase family protein [Opitutae bacterium]